jgi:hypothetical protein
LTKTTANPNVTQPPCALSANQSNLCPGTCSVLYR